MTLKVTSNQLSDLTEKQILNQLAIGQKNAFWTLWQQHQDYLFACCLKWTNGNSTEAEDLLSEGMLKAWEKAAKYAAKISNFKYWLRTLICNLWLDIKRRKGADQIEDIEVYATQEDLGRVSVDHTPQTALEDDEKRRVIRAAIDELPTKMRATFIRHFYQELSYQEIGEQQDISYQNVCKRISMARAILVKKLQGYFIGQVEIKPHTAKVAATPAKCKKAVQVEPILVETEQLDLCVNTNHTHQEIEQETKFLSPSRNQKPSWPDDLLFPVRQKSSLAITYKKIRLSSFLSPKPNQKSSFYINIEHLKPKSEKTEHPGFCLKTDKKTSTNTAIDSS